MTLSIQVNQTTEINGSMKPPGVNKQTPATEREQSVVGKCWLSYCSDAVKCVESRQFQEPIHTHTHTQCSDSLGIHEDTHTHTQPTRAHLDKQLTS